MLVVFKLITKMIVHKIQGVLNVGLHPGQYGFVSRRQIHDNIGNALVAIEYTSGYATRCHVQNGLWSQVGKCHLLAIFQMLLVSLAWYAYVEENQPHHATFPPCPFSTRDRLQDWKLQPLSRLSYFIP